MPAPLGIFFGQSKGRPWQTGLFTAGFDQALDGACQWYDTKFPRLHVRRYSTLQLHTMNAGARSVCVIAALC